jgi:2-polyprenyl-3-methyl-5-hydroxy-6-metoxy-1,4-benzoquinol methylase
MPHTFDERLNINKGIKQNIIYDEHIIRYELAKKFVRGKTVLDIACGSGYGSKILADAGAKKVIAIDINKETVESAKENYYHEKIKYTIGGASEIKLENKSIDIVVSFETIEHLENPEKYLSELARVIKDDGTAIISTPNKDIYQEKNPFHFKEFNKDEFNNLIRRYFKYCYTYKQTNGMASYISMNEEYGWSNNKVIFTNKIEPMYFIAVCSHKEVADFPKENIISINPVALNNLYNNPGLKIVNKIYSLIIKIPGVKKVISKPR